jgi:hypothetical protein
MQIARFLTCLLVGLFAGGGCGGGSNGPSGPSNTVTQVQVGVSGNGSTQLAPGETRQLFAMAVGGSGTSNDVTNSATWQSSNPALATVSNTGLLTASAEGSVEVSATYQNVRGSLRAEIARPSCDVTLSAATGHFNAFGGAGTLMVTVNPATCRWSATSDTPAWLPVNEPSRTGSGAVNYTVPYNSGVDPRSATITVLATSGQSAQHVVSQDRPVSCSYVTRPDSATFTAAGGSGSFDVITTPADCQWRASTTLGAFGVFITNGFSGTGAGRVTYTISAHTRSTDVDGFVEIAGLSGVNPPGQHRITILKR